MCPRVWFNSTGTAFYFDLNVWLWMQFECDFECNSKERSLFSSNSSVLSSCVMIDRFVSSRVLWFSSRQKEWHTREQMNNVSPLGPELNFVCRQNLWCTLLEHHISVYYSFRSRERKMNDFSEHDILWFSILNFRQRLLMMLERTEESFALCQTELAEIISLSLSLFLFLSLSLFLSFTNTPNSSEMSAPKSHIMIVRLFAICSGCAICANHCQLGTHITFF